LLPQLAFCQQVSSFADDHAEVLVRADFDYDGTKVSAVLHLRDDPDAGNDSAVVRIEELVRGVRVAL
jgi:hypothetical protein